MAPLAGSNFQKASLSRRTTSDDVFDEIFRQITSLKLMPGAKVSEVEIARQFDVSRQPVREAFIKLGNMGLLHIRPQRSTIVRKISLSEVADARFVRLSIELETVRRACENMDEAFAAAFDANLEEQRAVARDGDGNALRSLDSEFHGLICKAAGYPNVFTTIMENKLKVDRLCALSMKDTSESGAIIADHEEIVAALKSGDVEKAVAVMRQHMKRLDTTIEKISRTHREYFEDL